MCLSNTITFSEDFQISPIQNIFHAQPRVSEEILLSVLFKSNIWWSSKQVLWCVSCFYFGWRPRLRMKPCRQSTIANTPRKRAEVFSGSGSPSSCTHRPFNASADGSDAALPGQSRNRRLLSHLREGHGQGYPLQVRFHWPSWKTFCSGIVFVLILNLNNNNHKFIIFIAFLTNL